MAIGATVAECEIGDSSLAGYVVSQALGFLHWAAGWVSAQRRLTLRRRGGSVLALVLPGPRRGWPVAPENTTRAATAAGVPYCARRRAGQAGRWVVAAANLALLLSARSTGRHFGADGTTKFCSDGRDWEVGVGGSVNRLKRKKSSLMAVITQNGPNGSRDSSVVRGEGRGTPAVSEPNTGLHDSSMPRGLDDQEIQVPTRSQMWLEGNETTNFSQGN